MADDNKTLISLDNLRTFKGYIDAEIGDNGGTSLSGTIGSSNTPIYLSDGELRPITVTAGNSTKPVYVSNGEIRALSGTIGDYGSAPVCLQSGEFVALNSCGSASTPIYINADGNVKQCTRSLQNFELHYLFCFDEALYNRRDNDYEEDLNAPICLRTNLSSVDVAAALIELNAILSAQGAAEATGFSFTDINNLGLAVVAKEYVADTFRYSGTAVGLANVLKRYMGDSNPEISSSVIVGVMCEDAALLYLLYGGHCYFCIKTIEQIVMRINMRYTIYDDLEDSTALDLCHDSLNVYEFISIDDSHENELYVA